jgi:CheY-like chemotaxis protein
VVTDAPPGLPAAQADENQLEMAILNLSVNARDAMAQGGLLSLTVRAERVEAGRRSGLPAGQYIRLSVSDTGTGMDEATLARSVEPFFSTKGHGRGTGLGLSMTHGLASQLGGCLAIDSRPGAGTTVDLWLPASTAEGPVAAAGSAAPERAGGGAGSALLVDDESPARASTAAMLSDLGYEVIQAASAEEALEAVFGDLPVQLLVTDHLMPGMSGAELAEVFQEHRPGARALIITGYADSLPPDVAYLSKPFRRADLAASIAALEKAGSRPGPPDQARRRQNSTPGPPARPK